MAPSPTATAIVTSSLASAPSVRAADAGSPQLLVLAAGATGDPGLWTCGSDGSWNAAGMVPGATAIARDGQKLTLAGQGSLEFRDVSAPQKVGPTLSLKWASQAPQGTIVGVDRSNPGKAVVAIADSNGLAFAVVSAEGSAGLLSPSPESPFGPSVAWLDDDRLVALSVDTRQVPRLAVIDTAKRAIALLRVLGGVRLFSLSPDRLSLAAATESGVYVAPISDWLAEREPAAIVTLEPSQVVWDLALSGDGSRLAMLSGTEAADGTVSDTREIAYERKARAWMKILESPVPFIRANGQVWLM